jgi:hypothetical protein
MLAKGWRSLHFFLLRVYGMARYQPTLDSLAAEQRRDDATDMQSLQCDRRSFVTTDESVSSDS